MNDPLIAALPGAIASVVVGLIGAFAAGRPRDGGASTDQPPNPLHHPRHSRKFQAFMIAAGCTLAAGVLVVAYAVGQAQKDKLAKEKHDQEVADQTKNYADLVSKGLDGNKPYIMPSVVMMEEIEKSPDGQSITTIQKTVYQLQPLTDISSSRDDQQDLFREEYQSSPPIQRIPGSDREETPDRDFPNKWQVRFDAHKGEQHAILTGIRRTRPLTDASHSICIFPNLGPKEEAYCYPNYDGDVIGELMIIVQSKSVNLEEGHVNAVLRRANGTEDPVKATTSALDDGTQRTIVVRFPALNKNDIAGVKVGW